jgi:tyrosine-protein phosphatase YwqE
MFGWFKKDNPKKALTDLGLIGADMHSHLLPGIDDGAPDVETSVQLLKGMMSMGYKKFITTPHIYPDLYPNTPETIEAAYQLLKQKIDEEQLDVDLRYAAEYFIDDFFRERIQKGQKLLPIHDNWVLLEISFISPPPELNHVLFDLVTGGYQPILAHPERYSFYHRDKEIYHRFRDQGCFLQINLLSLIGYYGRPVQDTAFYLIEEGLVDLVGSDLHHTRHLEAMNNLFKSQELKALLESDRLLNHML